MKLLYNILYKMTEWCLNEKIYQSSGTIFLDPSTNEPAKAPKIPFDYKILVIATDSDNASDYANSLLLEPEHWTFVDSKSDIHQYNQEKCEIHAIGDWYKDAKCQQIVNWASKHSYKVI